METLNCTWNYYKTTEFINWSTTNTKECILNYSKNIGDKIWPGYGTIGFLILITLIIIVIVLYSRRKK